MPYAPVNGQQLHYTDTGGSGPVVACSHGFLMDHSMFNAQVTDLSVDHRIISWDERGFGATRTNAAEFTYWDSARDLLGLLDYLDIDDAILMGMSQGGFLSLRAALLAPERVRALILVATQAATETPEKLAEYEAMIAAWATHGYLDELADTVAGLIIGDPALEAATKDRWRAWDASGIGHAGQALLGRDDITDRLPEITMPVLCIHGTRDSAISLERARQVCQGVPDCRDFVEVEGGAHAVNMTHPEVVNPAIRRFLATL